MPGKVDRCTARPQIRVVGGLGLFVAAAGSAAFERIEVDAGGGSHVAIAGLSVGSGDWKRWEVADDWSLKLYGKTGADLWKGRDQNTSKKYVWDFSAYPVLRLGDGNVSEYSPYVEGSVGVNLLSHTRINDNRVFSTAFQFGEFLGAGVTFGERPNTISDFACNTSPTARSSFPMTD